MIARNPNAVFIFEEKLEKELGFLDSYDPVNPWTMFEPRWVYLSMNPNAINHLKNNQSKIIRHQLQHNPNIDLIESDFNEYKKYFDGDYAKSIRRMSYHCNLDWKTLSSNPNHMIIKVLEKNINKINWSSLSSNTNAIHILEKNNDKIDWSSLSSNNKAIHILEKNIDKIDWSCLSSNIDPFAIDLLGKNLDKIDWCRLSGNKNAIHILEKNLDKIDWSCLSSNTDVFAMNLLEKNIDKIDWYKLSANPSIFEIII
jgi:hypothetical protein